MTRAKQPDDNTPTVQNPIDARQTIAEQQQSDDFLTNLERLRTERRQRDQKQKPV